MEELEKNEGMKNERWIKGYLENVRKRRGHANCSFTSCTHQLWTKTTMLMLKKETKMDNGW